MSEELKPCPFCGGEARCEPNPDQGHKYHPTCYVVCDECGASSNPYNDRLDRGQAIAAWNSRTPPTSNAEGLREAAAKAIRDLATKEFGVGMSYAADFMGFPALNIYGKRATAAKWLMDNADAVLALLAPAIDGRREVVEECARVAENCPVEGHQWRRDIAAAIRRLSPGDGEGRE